MSNPLQIDEAQIKHFYDALFRYADNDTWVSCRSFFDDSNGVFEIQAVKTNNGDDTTTAIIAAAVRAAHSQRATVFCPPIATFSNSRNAAEKDLANGLALSVECDQHPNEARRTLETLLGSATLVVRSGGEWSNPETGEIEDKLHLHWRLKEPTRDMESHALLKKARTLATALVGGDASNKPIVHPIRWAGSWHRKHSPRLAQIVSEASCEIALLEAVETLSEALGAAGVASNSNAEKQNGADKGAGESRETDALVAEIISAREYHASLTALAMRYLLGGMADAQVVLTLRGVMKSVPVDIRDMKDGVLQYGRWQARYDEIPRAVKTARDKIDRYQSASPHSSSIRGDFRLVSIADLLREPKPHDWVMRGYIEKNTLNLLFGDPVTGKSLLAIDWAVCIATGREWNGCATKQGSVIYLAGEGHNGLSRRLKALEIAREQALDKAPFFASNAAISLIDDAGVQKIMEAAETMIDKHGIPTLLIVDTLARHFSGGDENAAPDMTKFIDAIDMLRQKYGCAVLVVHHSGHGNKERARAHSVLPAAVDSIFCLTTDKNGIRSLRCDKAKDFEPPKERAFTLRGVELPWFDDDQLTYLTAPVLEATAVLPTTMDKPLPPSAQAALRALCEAIEKAGVKAPAACIVEAGREFAIQGGKVVMIEDWKRRYSQICGKDSKEATRKSFGRARDVLLEQRRIKVFESWVWLPEDTADLCVTPTADI